MDRKIKKELQEIIGEMECPEDCHCCESGLEARCRARDVGAESFLECMEEHSLGCPFLVPHPFFCECSLRVYVSKKLKM